MCRKFSESDKKKDPPSQFTISQVPKCGLILTQIEQKSQ